MTEKKMVQVELTDEELKKAQGGLFGEGDSKYARVKGGLYEYIGHDDNLRYLCPKCGRPVHPGTGWRYYCDPCDESWFFECQLVPNMASGSWVKIAD